MIELDSILQDVDRLSLAAHLIVAGPLTDSELALRYCISRLRCRKCLATLEEAGYVETERVFKGRTPRLVFTITPLGRERVMAFQAELSRMLDLLSPKH